MLSGFLKVELQLNNSSVVDWTNFCREVNNITFYINLCLLLRNILSSFCKLTLVTSTMDFDQTKVNWWT